jgi:predicted transcriptional regulator
VATSPRSNRVTGDDRSALASTLAEQYAAGASIRALAEENGRSYGFVHRLLSEQDVAFRGRGGATRGPAAEPAKKAARPRKAGSAKASAAKAGTAKAAAKSGSAKAIR